MATDNEMIKALAARIGDAWGLARWSLDQCGGTAITDHLSLRVEIIVGAGRRGDHAEIVRTVPGLRDLSRDLVPLIETAARLGLPSAIDALPHLSSMNESAEALSGALGMTQEQRTP